MRGEYGCLFWDNSVSVSDFLPFAPRCGYYAAHMNRNSARGSSADTFAVVLEEIARHSRAVSADIVVSTDEFLKTTAPNEPGDHSEKRLPLPMRTSKPSSRHAQRESSPLSYEEALRLHSRCANDAKSSSNAAKLTAGPPDTSAHPAQRKTKRAAQNSRSSVERTSQDVALSLQPVQSIPVLPRRESVSLRLTEMELTLLKERSSECGLSVSAYMRSCVLDTEQLRAQVKQTLAEMRALQMAALTSQATLPASNKDNRFKGLDPASSLVQLVARILHPLFQRKRNICHTDAAN